MNDNQENKLSMYKRMALFLTNETAVWTANAPFTTRKNGLDTSISQIDGVVQIQELNRKGIAVDKSVKLKEAVERTIVLIGALKAFAIDTNNNTLKSSIDYSRSDIERLRDTDSYNKLVLIQSIATTNLSGAMPYGLTALQITDAATSTAEYDSLVPKPQLGIDEKQALTVTLNGLFKSADEHFKVMDNLTEQFKPTNPAFYISYKAAREIVDNSGGGGTGTGGGTGGGSPTTEIKAGLVGGGTIANIEYSHSMNGTTPLKLKSPGTVTMRFYFSASIGGAPGSVFKDVAAGDEEDVLAADILYDATKIFLNVKNLGTSTSNYQIEIG